MANENEATAGERDPIVVWLEEIRDFAGANTRSREMAQQAIDRLSTMPAAAAAPDQESPAPAASKIDRLVEESKAETERGRQARRQS